MRIISKLCFVCEYCIVQVWYRGGLRGICLQFIQGQPFIKVIETNNIFIYGRPPLFDLSLYLIL